MNSTTSIAAWISQSRASLWCFAASFSDHSHFSASCHDLVMISASVSSSKIVCLWMFRGDGLWDLLSGSSDGQCTFPSCLHPFLVGCEILLWDGPGLSSLVWWVHSQPSCEKLASTSLQLCPSFHALMHWHSSVNELHLVTWASSVLLLASAAASSESFSISSILDKNSSKIPLSSDLIVRWWCDECDLKWSALLFHLCRWYVVPCCMGGSCPDPP